MDAVQKPTIDFTGWIGSGTGILGAILLSMNIPISGFGYLFFLVSSSTLSWWSWKHKHQSMMTMQIVFTAINLNGCVNWLL